MVSGRIRALVAFAAAALSHAQSVISTRSGVIHFFEGAVSLNGQALESHLARFPTMADGSELRTGEGRAEVLLTPGVFLRMNAQSDIRLVTGDLAGTQVELLAGSVMVESGVPNPDTSVTVIYQGWGVHVLRQGVYRLDSAPPRLWVRQGAADVFAGDGAKAVPVDSGMDLPFGSVLVPERTSAEPADGLRDWDEGRSESISADDAITAQIDEDPASRAPGTDGFVDFPLLGVTMAGMEPGLYGGGGGALCMAGLCQPGFNSIYLPGFRYRPMILGTEGRGLPGYYVAPSRFPIGGTPVGRLPIGGVPITGVPVGGLPRIGVPGVPLTPAPRLPAIPVAPAPAPVRVAPPRLSGGHR